ncbi:MAG: FAD:protein FMN transferase, partial [Gammaproteobacteria bacterium]|nr:FAD:protein FMN transferase [Gammaproteobacteria bacterium]
MRRFGLLVLLNLLAGLPVAHAAWYEREEAIMGTRVAVQLWSEDPQQAVDAIDAVMADMHRTDDLMSTYKPESQLSQVNAHAYERAVQVDADIIDVVQKSIEYSRLSEGVFDVTYASVGYLYDYRTHQHPTEAQIAAALPGVDYRQLLVDPQARTIRFMKPGMRIDL